MSQTASIEQALTSLIPTLNGPLPPELVQLGLSLLARSRSVASSLKADEEIARPYACAQLACERLKKPLNLPAISPRPPCPPRIYKKLFSYLESALPASTANREPQTPRKPTNSAPASARTTPKTPLSVRRTPHSAKRDGGGSHEPPEWTMSTVRELVKAFSYPAAAPHIYTGVESIIPLLARMSAVPDSPSRPPKGPSIPSNSKVKDARTLGLIAVVLFYVLSRLMDQDITPEQYMEWRDTAVSKLLESPAGRISAEDDILSEIEQLMPMAQEEGWLQMEWFLNTSPQEQDDGDAMDGVEQTGREDVSAGSGRTLKDGGSDYIGLGTMMQDATDYLGERQRTDYTSWKAGIMARIEEIEAA